MCTRACLCLSPFMTVRDWTTSNHKNISFAWKYQLKPQIRNSLPEITEQKKKREYCVRYGNTSPLPFVFRRRLFFLTLLHINGHLWAAPKIYIKTLMEWLPALVTLPHLQTKMSLRYQNEGKTLFLFSIWCVYFWRVPTDHSPKNGEWVWQGESNQSEKPFVHQKSFMRNAWN